MIAASRRPRVAVVLAAGKGTRMHSEVPKVLHPAAGHPLLEWVLRAAKAAGCDETLVVVGHGAEQVRESISHQGVTWVLQEEQLGTGHALAQTASYIKTAATVLVLSGDAPLVSTETLAGLAEMAESGWGAVAAAEVDEPGSLGRVLADANGSLKQIVEAADADDETLQVKRVNAGMYAFTAPDIFEYLSQLKADNAKSELYLTDALGNAVADGRVVSILNLNDPAESLGVNTRVDLARVNRELRRRKNNQLMTAGVTILDPEATYIDADVTVGADTVIYPGVTILGASEIGTGCVLGQGVWVQNSSLGDGSEVEPYSVLDGAEVDIECRLGPFARLRPGSVVLAGAKVGNFVEIKNSRLEPGVKANHLAYLGDATIGVGANIGAGVVTCNYDGRAKHPTVIGPGAFVGSDTMLVAPVEIGEGAMTAAGSVISKDVPADALAVERGTQKNILGWMARFRGRGKRAGNK